MRVGDFLRTVGQHHRRTTGYQNEVGRILVDEDQVSSRIVLEALEVRMFKIRTRLVD